MNWVALCVTLSNKTIVNRVRLPSDIYERGEVVLMTVFEAVSLMISFGIVLIALLACIDKHKK